MTEGVIPFSYTTAYGGETRKSYAIPGCKKIQKKYIKNPMKCIGGKYSREEPDAALILLYRDKCLLTHADLVNYNSNAPQEYDS